MAHIRTLINDLYSIGSCLLSYTKYECRTRTMWPLNEDLFDLILIIEFYESKTEIVARYSLVFFFVVPIKPMLHNIMSHY